MGFLEERPTLLLGSLVKLLTKFRDHESLNLCSKSLHLAVLALFTRTEHLESESALKVVLELLATSNKDLNKGVLGDLFRFVIISRVCKLMNPIELDEDD